MQHRGTARTRIVAVAYRDGEAAPVGEPVMAGERSLGQTGGGAGARGLAMVRIDRLGEALAAGETVLAGGRAVEVEKPGFASFAWPV